MSSDGASSSEPQSALALLAKGTTVALFPLLAAGVVGLLWMQRPSRRQVCVWLGGVVIVPVVLLAPWIAFNLHEYHALSGGRVEARLVEVAPRVVLDGRALDVLGGTAPWSTYAVPHPQPSIRLRFKAAAVVAVDRQVTASLAIYTGASGAGAPVVRAYGDVPDPRAVRFTEQYWPQHPLHLTSREIIDIPNLEAAVGGAAALGAAGAVGLAGWPSRRRHNPGRGTLRSAGQALR